MCGRCRHYNLWFVCAVARQVIVQNFMQPSPVAQHQVLFGRPNPGRMNNSHGIVEFGTIDFFGHPKVFSTNIVSGPLEAFHESRINFSCG
jgi:hypothetical protein